jgi:hypothetical protein
VTAHERAQEYLQEMFAGEFTGVAGAQFPELQKVLEGSRRAVSWVHVCHVCIYGVITVNRRSTLHGNGWVSSELMT